MGCKCPPRACSCSFEDSSTVALPGAGTVEDPIQVVSERSWLEVADGDDMVGSIDGAGTVALPYEMSFGVDPALMDTKWGAWFGPRVEYESLIDQPGVLYVVNPGA